MSYKKVGLRIAAIVSAFMMIAISPATFAGMRAKADELSDLEAENNQLNNTINDLKNKIDQNQADLNEKQSYMDALNDKIKNAESQIDLYDSQIDQMNTEIAGMDNAIAAKQKEIDNKQASIDQRFQQLRQRLQAISKSGNMSTLQMLMDSDSYTDYLIKSKMMQSVAENDQRLMDELEAEIEGINAEKADLATQKDSVAQKRTDVQAKKDTSTSLKKQLDDDYAVKNAAAQQLQNIINSETSSKNEAEGNLEENQKVIDIIKSSSNNNTGSTGKYGGGTMFWPVPAVHNLSSTFGVRWGVLHRGVDIANGSVPIYGQDIVAAADGVVIYANSTNSWGGGYGYYVIIDHGRDSNGDDISTLYAHCSKILATVGEQVVGGQTVIAKAGATGDVTGPHLHFEVRVNGTAVDPIKNGYLKLN